MRLTNDREEGFNDIVRGNIFFSTDASQGTLYVRASLDLGVVDNNLYYGGGGTHHITTGDEGVYDDYTFTEWQELSGLDTHSKEIPSLAGPSVIFTNPTLNTVNVGLEGRIYSDLDGNLIEGAVELEPFASMILIEQ